jgi:hypothetical protein
MTVSGVVMIFCGRSVRFPRNAEPNGVFSFWFGVPVRYIGEPFLSNNPPAIGSLLGDGVLGEPNLAFWLGWGDAETGELPRVATAIKDLRSESELRRFFLGDFSVPSFP